MAYLEDIPKYAFGTTHEIETTSPVAVVAAGDQSDNREPGSSRASRTDLSKSNVYQAPPTTTTTTTTKTLQATPASKISESKFKALVLHAIKLGCRHFDCAPLYRTQHLVGQALSEAMSSQQVPRQKFFITSKLPPNMMRPENIMRSISKTIEELQCNYLDLFLIHAPFSTKHISDDNFYPLDDEGNLMLDEEVGLLENCWRKLVDLKRRGFTRYIGLSNINLEQLVRLNKIHHIDVVQNEYHIYNQDREIFDYCEEIDVHFEAYAAMGNPDKARRDGKPCVALDPTVQRVARENRLSIAEVNIQWVYQQPLSYVIRCDTPRQLEENLRATKCISLPVNDLIDLDSLNRDVRLYLFDEHEGLVRHREYPFKRLTKENEWVEFGASCGGPNLLLQHRNQQARLQQQQLQLQLQQQRQLQNRNNINNNNIDSDLSSSDCSDLSGEKISIVSNLKTSSSQSDSSITTTIARCSTPMSVSEGLTGSGETASAATAATTGGGGGEPASSAPGLDMTANPERLEEI